MTIYENTKDQENENELGLKFITHSKIQVGIEKTPKLHPFDYEILVLSKDARFGWLEVKQKAGSWEGNSYEICPEPKCLFALENKEPCFLLVERNGCGRIFNLSNLLSKNLGFYTTITRGDRPTEKRKVFKFETRHGKLLYMEGHDPLKDLDLDLIKHIQEVRFG